MNTRVKNEICHMVSYVWCHQTVLSVNSHHRRTGNYSESNFSLAVNMMKMMRIFFTVSLNLRNSTGRDANKRTRRPLHVLLLLQHKFSPNVDLNSDFESCWRENSKVAVKFKSCLALACYFKVCLFENQGKTKGGRSRSRVSFRLNYYSNNMTIYK